jgi:hypothetical protein
MYAVTAPTGAKTTRDAWVPRPPLPDLTGKTVCELWDYVYRGDEMFDVIRTELTARYEGIRFVGYAEFGNIHGATEQEVVGALSQRLREFRVDAAIVGVGS